MEASVTSQVGPDAPAKAAAQSQPDNPVSVPDVVPQAATIPSPDHRSATDRRWDAEKPPPLGPEAFDKAAAGAESGVSEGFVPPFGAGTRVQIIGGSEAGRMAYVWDLVFSDPAERAKYYSGDPELRSQSKPSAYIVKTRDGRSDTFSVKPEDVQELDTINGWGRGSI